MNSQEPPLKSQRLKKPMQITDHAWPEGTVPLVSIQCVTYNHVQFISDAIDGFLMQETTFPVEIVIHDDASNDGTTEIIKEYEKKYPSLFRNIVQKSNLWPNIPSTSDISQKHCRGNYIAICEGDDYWTKSNKLEEQVKALEKNPSWSGCFHDASVVDNSGKTLSESYYIPSRDSYSQEDCLAELLSQQATASMMFKKDAVLDPPLWYELKRSDMMLDLLIARSGKFGFLPINACAYRKHDSGSWTSLSFVEQVVELISRYDHLLLFEPFKTQYKDVISKKRKELFMNLYASKEHYDEIAKLKETINNSKKQNIFRAFNRLKDL